MRVALDAWCAALGVPDTALALTLIALLVARIAPALWLLSRASWQLGGWVVLSASTLLACVLLPHASVHAPATMPTGAMVAIAGMRELVIGAGFGWIAGLPLSALRMAGGLLDRASGTHDSRPMTTLCAWLGITLSATFGIFELALRALVDSVQAMPVGVLFAVADARAAIEPVIGLCASAIAFGLVWSIPAVLGATLADAAQALLQRWLSGWPAAALWPSTRQLVVWALSMLSLSFVASVLPTAFAQSIQNAQRWIDRLTP